jgi:hypothetical protein
MQPSNQVSIRDISANQPLESDARILVLVGHHVIPKSRPSKTFRAYGTSIESGSRKPCFGYQGICFGGSPLPY